MKSFPLKSQIFLYVIILFAISYLIYISTTLNVSKLLLVTSILFFTPFVSALIISAVVKPFISLSFIILFNKILKVTSIITGILLFVILTYGVIHDINENSKGNVNSFGLKGKMKNWSNTNFCKQMSPNKTILLLPVYKKHKLNKSSVVGVEIVNCTDSSYMLAGKEKNITFNLEKHIEEGNWKVEWELSNYICQKEMAWVLKSNKSWNIEGFKSSKSKLRSKYRFSLQVREGEKIYSREFQDHFEIPQNSISEPFKCNDIG